MVVSNTHVEIRIIQRGKAYPAALSDINWRFMPWPVQSMPGTYNSIGAEKPEGWNACQGCKRATCTKLLSVTCGRGQEGSEVTISVNVLFTISASLSATSSTVSTCSDIYSKSRRSLLISWLIVHSSARLCLVVEHLQVLNWIFRKEVEGDLWEQMRAEKARLCNTMGSQGADAEQISPHRQI